MSGTSARLLQGPAKKKTATDSPSSAPAPAPASAPPTDFAPSSAPPTDSAPADSAPASAPPTDSAPASAPAPADDSMGTKTRGSSRGKTNMAAPKSTHVPDLEGWEIDFQNFPEHLKFLQKLRTAQQNANDTGKRAQLCWRGHRTSIGPKANEGRLSKCEFLQRLIVALRSVKSIKKQEHEV